MSVKLTSEAAMRARSGQGGVIVAKDYQGRSVVASPRLIPRLNWCLIAKIDLSEAYAGMYRVTAWWVLLTMLMIAGGYVLARVTAARMVAPVYALSAAARRMAAGDGQARVSLQRDDELGDLAVDFNLMADEVFRTREDLERLVEERTAELQAAIKELQQVNQEMAAFTYSVSHDLAAPLVSLQGLTRILLRDYSDRLDVEGIRRLQRLQVNVQMLESLVNDLLELSRVGRIETNPVDLDPAAAVAEVVTSLQDTITSSGAEIIAPDLGVCPRVHVEPNRLRQILSNLLSNAIKYGVSGTSPRIEITCHGDDARFVRITVADNGPGIPPEQRERVFRPFQRLRGSPDTTGTGMGLAIARKIVEHYGGSIWVDDPPGGGAAFSFTLPRAEPGNGEE